MLTSAEHARVGAQTKARRNAVRRRPSAVSWLRDGWHRCVGCEAWIGEAETVGWDARFARRWCEGCALAEDLRRAVA